MVLFNYYLLLLTIIFVILTKVDSTAIFLEDTPGEGGFFDVVEKNKFRLPCITTEPMKNGQELKWTTVDNVDIDSASPSRFTISQRKSSGQLRQTLVFMDIQLHDEGTYYCQLFEGSKLIKRIDVNIRVSKAVVWSSNASEVGGKLGEPLTVDCGTKSNPDANIEAYDQYDKRLEESELKFVRANNEYTVQQLTDLYQNALITCTAFITMTNKVTAVITKAVRIKVWKKPQFSHTNQTLYAIASQTTQIKCEIESSVPPVINFKFTKNGRLLETSTHHRIDSYPEQNFANLTIVDVQDEDFGHYSCIAHNGILGNDMLVDLLAATPPKQPKVTFLGFSNKTTTWKIINTDKNELPVLTYSIRFCVERHKPEEVMETGVFENNMEEWLKNNQHTSSEVVVMKDPSNTYTIHGLFKTHKYMFEFTPRNAAGHGEAFYVAVSLENEIKTANGSYDIFNVKFIIFNISLLCSIVLFFVLY